MRKAIFTFVILLSFILVSCESDKPIPPKLLLKPITAEDLDFNYTIGHHYDDKRGGKLKANVIHVGSAIKMTPFLVPHKRGESYT